MKELQKYLKKHPNEIIENINEFLEELDIDISSIPTNEAELLYISLKKEIVKHNEKVLNSEITKKKLLEEKRKEIEEDIVVENKSPIILPTYTTFKIEQNDSFIDASEYVSSLIKCRAKEEILSYLPNEYTPNYHQLLKAIILKIQSYIVFYTNYSKQVDNDEKELIIADIIRFKFIIDTILDITKEDKKQEEEDKPNIYFLTKNKLGDNTSIVVSDLDEIVTPNNYLYFKKIIDDFNTGNFLLKNNNVQKGRTFNNNQSIQKLIEAKNNEARITYYNLGNKNYILLHAFVKKTDRNTYNYANLYNSYEIFKKQEDEIRSNLNNPEYLVEQQVYMEEAYKILAKRGGYDV